MVWVLHDNSGLKNVKITCNLRNDSQAQPSKYFSFYSYSFQTKLFLGIPKSSTIWWNLVHCFSPNTSLCLQHLMHFFWFGIKHEFILIWYHYKSIFHLETDDLFYESNWFFYLKPQVHNLTCHLINNFKITIFRDTLACNLFEICIRHLS